MLSDVWLFHFNLKSIFDLVMKKYQLSQLHRRTEQCKTSLVIVVSTVIFGSRSQKKLIHRKQRATLKD